MTAGRKRYLARRFNELLSGRWVPPGRRYQRSAKIEDIAAAGRREALDAVAELADREAERCSQDTR